MAANLRDANNSLGKFFIRVFCKFGFDSQEETDRITFESQALRGEVTLKKPFAVSWKTKRGFEIADHPIANGTTTAYFKKASDLLDFLRRSILHR
jgi:hypothetical protein